MTTTQNEQRRISFLITTPITATSAIATVPIAHTHTSNDEDRNHLVTIQETVPVADSAPASPSKPVRPNLNLKINILDDADWYDITCTSYTARIYIRDIVYNIHIFIFVCCIQMLLFIIYSYTYMIYTYRIQVDEGSDNGDDDNNNTSRTYNTTNDSSRNPRINTNNVPRSALLKKSHPDRGLRVSTGASSSGTGTGEKGLGTARSLAPHDSYIFTNSGK